MLCHVALMVSYLLKALEIEEDEVQVAVVCSGTADVSLLSRVPHDDPISSELPTEQKKTIR